jgi:hypothetical protein
MVSPTVPSLGELDRLGHGVVGEGRTVDADEDLVEHDERNDRADPRLCLHGQPPCRPPTCPSFGLPASHHLHQAMKGMSSGGIVMNGRIMSRSSCSRMWQWYM